MPSWAEVGVAAVGRGAGELQEAFSGGEEDTPKDRLRPIQDIRTHRPWQADELTPSFRGTHGGRHDDHQEALGKRV